MADRDRDAQHDDEELLDELRALFERIDPVPKELLDAARASLVLHTLEAEMASLTYDSDVDPDRLALVRGPSSSRMLTFSGSGIEVEVEAVVVGVRRRLAGQLVPGQPADVEVSHRGGVSATAADDLGRFVSSEIEAGPVRVRCRVGGSSDRTVVDTDWFVA